MELRKFLSMLTIILILLLVLLVWFLPSDEDFRTENPFWNGAKGMSTNHLASPLASLSDLPSSPQGTKLILIPYLEFTMDELETLSSFVTQGGTLILADDYGYGNQILEHLGLQARFSGQELLDPLVHHKNQRFPRIPRIKTDPLTSNIENLTFNHATCLVNVKTADVLALSSLFSFLDLNGDQAPDKGEPNGPLPVISRHNMGSGQIILIADPSIFLNSMEKMEGNNTLITNIAATSVKSLFLDQSHLPPSDLHQAKHLLAQIRSLLTTPAVTLGLVLLVLIITLKPIWQKQDTIRHMKGDNNDHA